MHKKQSAWQFIYFYIAAAIILIFVLSAKAGIYDWDKELFYAKTIRDSILQYRSLPYVLWNRDPFTFYPIVGQTSLFISYPETFLFSPLMPLSLWLEPVVFLKVVTLFHFAIGCAGVWMLGRLLKWDASQIRLFSASFLLSPIILQHVAIGYLPWITLYYFPWLLYFISHQRRLVRITGTGAVLAASLLNGGTHTTFWYGLFIAVTVAWAVVWDRQRWRLAVDAILAAGASALLGFARLYSSFMAFGNFSQDFFAGYSIKAFLRMTLIPPMFFIKDIDHVESLIEDYIDGVPYWDGGIYWGIVLVVVLLVLAAIAGKRKRKESVKRMNLSLPIFLCGVTFLVLAMGSVYATLAGIASRLTGIGGLTGIEKYPFRFAIMAYLGFIIFISSHLPELILEMKHWGDRIKKISETAFQWIFQNLKNHRPFIKNTFKMMIILFIFIAFLNIVIKPALLPIIHGLIRDAYEGTGWPVLGRLMVNKGTLPLNAYIEKGDAFIDLVLYRSILIISITACVLAIAAYPRQMSSALRRIIETLVIHRLAIIELAIALPLLFASLMWLRVAVSTPLNSYATLSETPILSKTIAPEDAYLEVIDHSPGHIEMICLSLSENPCEIVVDIPYNDSSWLKTVNVTRMGNRDDYLGLEIPAGEKIVLQVDRSGFDTAVWIMLGSWAASVIGLIFWMLRRINLA